ncbi:IS66 family insertion sequence element accessory protein TnpA [Pendulispora albinea]|uniref:IS66 family insertion sequence element accessory protein TnpA n=1 Tax=Pendulispora albinea TaxID=2741071 RepID=UPI00374E086D
MSKGKLDEIGADGRGRRTRWTAAVARTMLEECAASGESIAAFAKRRGFDPQRLRLWKQRLGNKSSTPAPAAEFLPVRVADTKPKETPRARISEFEVVLAKGRTIRIGKDFDSHSLCRLVEALEGGAR